MVTVGDFGSEYLYSHADPGTEGSTDHIQQTVNAMAYEGAISPGIMRRLVGGIREPASLLPESNKGSYLFGAQHRHGENSYDALLIVEYSDDVDGSRLPGIEFPELWVSSAIQQQTDRNMLLRRLLLHSIEINPDAELGSFTMGSVAVRDDSILSIPPQLLDKYPVGVPNLTLFPGGIADIDTVMQFVPSLHNNSLGDRLVEQTVQYWTDLTDLTVQRAAQE